MRHSLHNLLILAVALGFATVFAQTAAKPAGHDLQVELTTAVKAKKAKVGDTISAVTVTPVTLANGTVLPAGSKVTGHVRQVEADSGDSHTSLIAISFEEAAVKKGETVPLNCFVRAALMPALKGITARETEQGQTIAPMTGAARDGMGVSPMGGSMGMGSGTGMGGGAGAGTMGTVVQGTPQPQDSPKPVTAHNGQVIGMRGVELQMDAPQHLSTFRSEHKNLELDEGLQLMLVVQQ